MPTPEQKKRWRQEKEQMLRDKKNQPKEIHRRAVPLKLGKPKKSGVRALPQLPAENLLSDQILRKNLGI